MEILEIYLKVMENSEDLINRSLKYMNEVKWVYGEGSGTPVTETSIKNMIYALIQSCLDRKNFAVCAESDLKFAFAASGGFRVGMMYSIKSNKLIEVTVDFVPFQSRTNF